MTKIENGSDTPTNVQEYFESIKGNHAALRQFFTAMPKGGDVHNHLTGSAYAETYFELAAKKKMYVNLETGKLYKEKPEGIETIQLTKEMDDLHNHRMALIDKWSIRNFQPYKYPLGPDEYFFGTFGLLSALTSVAAESADSKSPYDVTTLIYLLNKLLDRAANENVQYLEVMGFSPIIPEYCFLGPEKYELYDTTLKEYVKNGDYTGIQSTLKEILDLFDKNPEAKKADENYFSAIMEIRVEINRRNWETGYVDWCLQGYTSRGGEPLLIFAQLYVVYKVSLCDYSSTLRGCNIVAAENGEKSMLYYHLHMEMFAALATKFPDVLTSLHAGELTMGLMRPEHLTYHINQAVNIAKAHRIGHGVDLPFEQNSDELLKVMESKSIPVEINLTSNEFILGVKDSEHPISLYHKAGVPVMLCTDDPGILRTSLTEQYTLAVLRYGFSYEEIKSFVLNSITYAFLADADKTKLIKKVNALLAEFERKISIRHLEPDVSGSEN